MTSINIQKKHAGNWRGLLFAGPMHRPFMNFAIWSPLLSMAAPMITAMKGCFSQAAQRAAQVLEAISTISWIATTPFTLEMKALPLTMPTNHFPSPTHACRQDRGRAARLGSLSSRGDSKGDPKLVRGPDRRAQSPAVGTALMVKLGDGDVELVAADLVAHA